MDQLQPRQPVPSASDTLLETRRRLLKGGLAAAGISLLGVPEWVLPVMAQGAVLVPFTDVPADANFTPTPDRRTLDTRRIDGPITPADQFFTLQHYGHPTVDIANYRLTLSGLVERPLSLTLADVRSLGSQDMVVGFECSGNRGPLQGASGNGRWTGVPLRTVLERAGGLKTAAREVVFFGADGAEEEVDWRGRKFPVTVKFGRSLSTEKALSPEPFLAWALNGQPLTTHQGAPLRLVVPGWYGVANVKWLMEIRPQQERYVGKWQAREYRTIKGEMVDGVMKWYETAIEEMRLKSWVARVTREGTRHRVLVVTLNDGTPLRSVEVKVDNGSWQPATADASTTEKYGWRFYTYDWPNPTPGEHTLVSRVTDANGQVQPEPDALANKVTFLESHQQAPRTVMVS
ncbi:MAG: molybdopterin-dependent oxidoreductase [Acidobacteria bacterium]|nr:molybdopterin-dependent oxidoreductase [Acidobacteriota bacterium]